MRNSIIVQSYQLVNKNSRKCKTCKDSSQPFFSAIDLDKAMVVTDSKMGIHKLSLLENLSIVKDNDPSHKKRKAN